MLAIYKREMRAYFTTPTGYVFVAVFLCAAGFLFSLTTLQAQSSDVSLYYQLLMIAYIVLIPLLTMRSFAEEKRSKTEQLLLTAPVRLWAMVAAKFFAALTLFAGTVALSSFAFVPYALYAKAPNWGRVLGCTVGIFLIGICFIAIGMFLSSLTENQFTASVCTIGVLAGLVALALLNSFLNSFLLRQILGWISIYSRFQNFALGIFDFSSAVYYLSLCIVFLFLTVRVYEKRRFV